MEVKINKLSKCFNDVCAIRDINLSLSKGNMLAVLGPSGCGKTTLLRCIAGFETPDSGSISIAGKEIFNSATNTNIKPEHRRIGYVPQEGVLFPHLTVAQNIGFGLPRNSQKRIQEMLELIGLPGLGERMPHEISGGQQQRVALARALAPAPSLVLLDEPFSALDAGLRTALREDVKHTLKEIGATAIIVTHDQEEALSMADMVTVMRQGSCIQTADPISLYKYPADLQVARFVGDATIVEAEILNGVAKSPFGYLAVANGCPKECKCATIMIRPEQFVIGENSEQIGGYVDKVVFYGRDALIHLKMDEKLGMDQIRVRVMGSPIFSPGDYVGLQIDGEVMAYPDLAVETV